MNFFNEYWNLPQVKFYIKYWYIFIGISAALLLVIEVYKIIQKRLDRLEDNDKPKDKPLS